MDQAQSCSHSGQCGDDVAELRRDPGIAAQLAALDPDKVRRSLSGYGAWDASELADHDANLDRLLWLACGDVAESPDTYRND
jgi:hypothetical protein